MNHAELICDALILSGVIAVAYGSALLHPALPWILVGGFAAAAGLGGSRLAGRARRRKRNTR